MAGCVLPGIGRTDGVYLVYSGITARFPADRSDWNAVAYCPGAFRHVHCADGSREVGEACQEKRRTMISNRPASYSQALNDKK